MQVINPEEIDTRPTQIAKAEALQRLMMNEDYIMLYEEGYLTAFAVTNIYNLHMYDTEGRRRFLEKSLARSVFSYYNDTILEEGREALESMREETETE